MSYHHIPGPQGLKLVIDHDDHAHMALYRDQQLLAIGKAAVTDLASFLHDPAVAPWLALPPTGYRVQVLKRIGSAPDDHVVLMYQIMLPFVPFGGLQVVAPGLRETITAVAWQYGAQFFQAETETTLSQDAVDVYLAAGWMRMPDMRVVLCGSQ